jgi:hypothetical protein
VRLALLFVIAALSAPAQTNSVLPTNRLNAISNSPTKSVQNQTNQGLAIATRVEEIRAACIQSRRLICGKILKVLPEGLVVDSGYSSLMRPSLGGSWLVPGTVVAPRDASAVEGNQPDAICIGVVFLTDLPKLRGAKPKVYDYVRIEAFPAGRATYTSVGDLQRTVRKFSAKLANATRWKFEENEKQKAPLK